MAIVTLDRLSKIYGQTHPPAVDNVSLEIGHGEFMVLLGPSGCGKTTTLRMIAGLESISSGTLSIDGAPVNSVAAKDRDIAMVFQSYALYPHMSVRENLAFGLRRRKVPRAEIAEKVDAVAGILELSPLLERKPHALSGGQRQRVALGRAIVRDPKVFLFDEPLSNLDAALRVSTRSEITDLHRRLGATMIYVTHDQVEAMTMGTRICIMNGGKVMQIGRPLDVYRAPANLFVAGFLGNPAMNLLDIVAIDAPGGRTFALGENRFELGPQRTPEVAPGSNVTLGIRPEDVSVNDAQSGRTACLAMDVVAVEALGAETIIAATADGVTRPIVIRVPGTADLVPGDRHTFHFNLDQAHIFDGDGLSLTAGLTGGDGHG